MTQKGKELLDIEPHIIAMTFGHLKNTDELICEENWEIIYLPPFYHSEVGIARRIHEIASTKTNKDNFNFENSQKDVCVYYHRDRGEKWESVKSVTYKDINDWEKKIKQGWQEYMYLFKNGKWYFTDLYNKKIAWKKLKTYLKKEIANNV